MNRVWKTLTAALALVLVGTATAQPQATPDQLFVRKQVNLREGSTVASTSLGLVEPGTMATQLDLSADGRFVRVKTEDGKEGWIAKDFVASYRALELRRELEALPDFDVMMGPTSRTFSVRAAATQCPKTLLSCPASGCTSDPDRKAFNRGKRFFPKVTGTPKLLTFDILRQLQTVTNNRGVPQGSPPNAAERKLLKSLQVGGETFFQGDYVELIGFLASDRDVRCGGAESVNCKLSNSSSQSGPCDKTDIHVPLVEVATDDQWKSVVVEPISQGRPTASGKVTTGKNVGEWTPPFFDKLKDDKTKIRVRGGLFYDGEHLVNRNPNVPRDDEPKRITLWEIHPLTEILICNQEPCDPANDAHWTRVGKVN